MIVDPDGVIIAWTTDLKKKHNAYKGAITWATHFAEETSAVSRSICLRGTTLSASPGQWAGTPKGPSHQPAGKGKKNRGGGYSGNDGQFVSDQDAARSCRCAGKALAKAKHNPEKYAGGPGRLFIKMLQGYKADLAVRAEARTCCLHEQTKRSFLSSIGDGFITTPPDGSILTELLLSPGLQVETTMEPDFEKRFIVIAIGKHEF